MGKNNNQLSNTQRGGMLETLFLCLAPMLFWIIVKEVLCTGLFITLLMVIKYAMLKKQNAKERGLVPSKYFYITFAGLTAVIVAIMGYHMVFCHNVKTEVNVNKEPETVESVPEEQKEEVKEDEKTEEVKADDKTEETSNQKDPNGRKVAGSRTWDAHGAYTNPDGTLKDAIVAKKEANDPTKSAAKAETTTGKTENTIVDNSNAKADEKTEKIIEEARKDDTKKVEDYKNDIVVITTPATEDKKVEEPKSVDPAKDIKVDESEVKDISSNENKVEETTISEVSEEDDKVVEMDKDELAELFKNAKKEEKSEKTAPKTEEPKEEVKENVETKTDAVVKTEEVVEETIVNEEAKGNVKVEEAVEKKTETPVVEEKVEVKSVEAVKVTAIDGYNATVGSTIQFKVSGDDVKIDGLDGINYTFNNGILSVNTGSEATVLTVEASNSVNTVSFDITINGIAQ